MQAYAASAAGFDEAYLEQVSESDDLVVFGAGPRASIVGFRRQALLEARPFPSDIVGVVSKALEMHLADDLAMAWVFDEPSYRVRLGELVAFVPMRFTAVYRRVGDSWTPGAEPPVVRSPPGPAARARCERHPGAAGAHRRPSRPRPCGCRGSACFWVSCATMPWPDANASPAVPDSLFIGPGPRHELRGEAITRTPHRPGAGGLRPRRSRHRFARVPCRTLDRTRGERATVSVEGPA